MAWFRGPITMNTMCGNGEFTDCGNEDFDMYWIVLGSGCDEICCNRPGIVVGMRDLQREKSDIYKSEKAISQAGE